MKVKTLSLSKPQRETLLNHYRVGAGIIALHNDARSVTTMHIYVDRSGVLRHADTNTPLLPLQLRTPARTSTLPYEIPVSKDMQIPEARLQALAICRSANRHLAEIDAIRSYRREAVRTVLQREATGWVFRAVLGGDDVHLMVEAPEGYSWLLARDSYGYWAPLLDHTKGVFERSWGGLLNDTWNQRVLDAAAMVMAGIYHVYPLRW
jgi:hypothetical protein